MPGFTKKHYTFLASVIANEVEQGRKSFSVESFVPRLANALAMENPSFNRDKFLAACKVEEV